MRSLGRGAIVKRAILAFLALALFASSPALPQIPGHSFGLSNVDPYILNNLTPHGNPNDLTNTAGRTMVSPVLGVGQRTIVLLVWGQSNSECAATGSLFTPAHPTVVQNLSVDNGAVYQAVEPLLGCGVGGGAWSTQLADALITDNYADRVIIETIGVGGTKSADWAAGGYLNHRIGVAARRYLAMGISPTRLFGLTHQGEDDCAAGTSQSAYATTKASEIATWRAIISGLIVFIAQASYQLGTTCSAITAAQAGLVDNVTTFSLGNFDVIPAGNRIGSPGTDYNGAGMTQAAGIAKAQIEAYLNTH